MACDHCEEEMRLGHRFCGYCGEPLAYADRPRSERSLGLNAVMYVVVPVMLITLALEFGSMLAGSVMTFQWLGDKSTWIFVLFPGIVRVCTISGIALQLYWIFLMAAITASVFLMAKECIPFIKAPSYERKKTFQTTSLYWLCIIFCADMLMSVITALLLNDGSTPDFDQGFVPSALFDFAQAAVWEEVLTRMAFIGLPMAAVALVCREKGAWRYLFGGFGFSRLVVVLMVISSLIFGYGHYSGWGLWKVLPTALGGFLMAYMYVRFGIHMSIMCHFILDYTSILMEGPTLAVLLIFELVTIFAGIVCTLEIFRRVWKSKDQIRSIPNIMPEDHESSFFKR